MGYGQNSFDMRSELRMSGDTIRNL